MSLTYFSGHPHRPGGPLTGPIANDARSQAMALAAAQRNTEVLRQLALGLLDPRAVIDPQADLGRGNRYGPFPPSTRPGMGQGDRYDPIPSSARPGARQISAYDPPPQSARPGMMPINSYDSPFAPARTGTRPPNGHGPPSSSFLPGTGPMNGYDPISPFTPRGTRQSNQQASRSLDPPNRTQTTRSGRIGESNNSGTYGY